MRVPLYAEVIFVAANIDMAIKACRPESGNLLRNREQMQQVKESLNEGYCDISGRAEDLQHAGTVGALKVYLSAGMEFLSFICVPSQNCFHF